VDGVGVKFRVSDRAERCEARERVERDGGWSGPSLLEAECSDWDDESFTSMSFTEVPLFASGDDI